MTEIIGVRFEKCGSTEYYVTAGIDLVKGDYVIAETSLGVEIGIVILTDCNPDTINAKPPIRAIIRKASQEDLEIKVSNEEKEKEAAAFCKERIIFYNLPMKLVKVKYLFDNKKLMFYFFSENRVDFRTLVKDLAAAYRTRIELRQIGVRDEARMIGGLGSCGRPLCCSAGINAFQPVSIKMAKEQNLSLNPSSISGTCGRLMCCLAYENNIYEDLHKNMPAIGDFVVSKEDESINGSVIAVNILSQSVKVLVSEDNKDKEIHIFKVEDIKVKDQIRNKESYSQVESKVLKETNSIIGREDRAYKEDNPYEERYKRYSRKNRRPSSE